MVTLAVITTIEEIFYVIPWSVQFAKARKSSLKILCATRSSVRPMSEESIEVDQLSSEVHDFINSSEAGGVLHEFMNEKMIEVCERHQIEASIAALKLARSDDVELIVAAAEDQTGETGCSYNTNPLLRDSSCNTVILLGGRDRSCKNNRIFVGITDSPHDGAALFLANQILECSNSTITLARAEMDYEDEVIEVGRRELLQLMRDTGVGQNDRIDCQVFRRDDYAGIASSMNEHDLLMIGANHKNMSMLKELTTFPTIAVIKRAPPLRPWNKSKRSSNWNSSLSPADYADLIQGLRRGSRCNADFLIMLSLSVVVASMGLLQDSPAVVIGSMLLAPLMTPMLGCGLALAQANPKLGNTSLVTVLVGLCCVLGISYGLGILTPGSELTPQVLARGNPTVLDLIVALASASAAAYALARPSLVGSIAGVAIATALVPPLCSTGLSLAYKNLANAQGAAILFLTNFVVIVLCAAGTFRLMGVTSTRANSRQRKWVFQTVTVLVTTVVLLCVPLHYALMKNLVDAKPQSMTYPLATSVMNSLEQRLAKENDVVLISAGMPSSPNDETDVILILGTPHHLEQNIAKELINIVKREMLDDTLIIEIHCIRELWKEVSK
ncbi:MAG: DUF389 domain-containing protein [Gimesia sp.]